MLINLMCFVFGIATGVLIELAVVLLSPDISFIKKQGIYKFAKSDGKWYKLCTTIGDSDSDTTRRPTD